MDDLVLNVRQIAQYPLASWLSTDQLILQRGLGGEYITTTPIGLVAPQLVPLQNDLINLEASMVAADNALEGQITEVNSDLTAAIAALANKTACQIENILDNSVYSFNGRRGNVFLTPSDVLPFLQGLAPIVSPQFKGVPTTPFIIDPKQDDYQIANTNYVQRAINDQLNDLLIGMPFVHCWNGRTGNVNLELRDVVKVFYEGPGEPFAPTPPSWSFSDRIATTRFVGRAITDLDMTLTDFINNEIARVAQDLLDHIHEEYAPINSPEFTGIPTGPTAPQGSNNSQLATTAFVMNAIVNSVAGVVTFNGRSGHITLELSDITGAGGAPIASPHFTGSPLSTTPPAGDNSTRIATTAFVTTAVNNAMANAVTSFNGRHGAVTLTLTDVTNVGGAPLNSPLFTGTPRASTPLPGDNSTRLATTAFITSAIATLNSVLSSEIANLQTQINAGVRSFNGRTGAITLQGNDISAAGGALTNSPIFTGMPRAPTQPVGTNDTTLATTAFVQSAIAAIPLGPPGPIGPMGPSGQDGQSYRILGSVPNFGALPIVGNMPGDVRITADNGEGYTWNGTAWVAVGQLQGPVGPIGPQGPKGDTGQGLTLKGTVTDPSQLPQSGNSPGDTWVTDDGNGFVWDGTQWVSVGQIRGPQGLQGIPGIPGITGPGGPIGPQGVGTTVSATAPQDPSLGDAWLDTSLAPLVPPTLKVWNGTNWVSAVGPYLPLHGGTMDRVDDTVNSGIGITINNTSANKVGMLIQNNATTWGVGLQIGNTCPTTLSAGGLNIQNTGFTGLSINTQTTAQTGMYIDNSSTNGSCIFMRQWGKGTAIAMEMSDQGGDALGMYEDVLGYVNPRLRIKKTGNITVGRPAPSQEVDTPGSINVTDNYYINGVPISAGAGTSININPPANPRPGQFWFDPTRAQLYVYFDDGDSQQWVVAVNQPSGGGGGGPINYSTSEQDTGITWLDGAPIYQKTIQLASPNYQDNVATPHGIVGLAMVVSISNVTVTPSGSTSVWTMSGGPHQVRVTSTDIILSNNRASYDPSGPMYVTLKYTKA